MIDNQLFTVQPCFSQAIVDGITAYVYTKDSLRQENKDTTEDVYERLAQQLDLKDNICLSPIGSLDGWNQSYYVKQLNGNLHPLLEKIDFAQHMIFLRIDKSVFNNDFPNRPNTSQKLTTGIFQVFDTPIKIAPTF